MKNKRLVIGLFILLVCGMLFGIFQVSLAEPQPPGVANPAPGFFATYDFKDLLQLILKALLSVASLVAVIFVVLSGYQYIFSQGNPEKVEKAKKSLIAAIAGIVIIFVSFVLIEIVFNVVKSGDINPPTIESPE